MPAFSSLEIGKRALLAQRFGLDVTSNNIANVNTPGYSRRTAQFTESNNHYDIGNFYGTGVIAEQLRTFREEFFDKEIRETKARQAEFEADEQVYQRLEAILAEPTDLGLNEVMSEFLNAFEDLGVKPENITLRENVISKAQTLVDRFHSTATQIKETREEVLVSLNESVTKANGLVTDIAELNAEITSQKSLTGESALSYIDERERKIEELTGLAASTVTFEDNGGANIYINGINLVTQGDPQTIALKEKVDSETGERTLYLATVDSQENSKNVLNPTSGELKSMLNHFNVTLDDSDSSGDLSVMERLDTFAGAVVESVNSIMNEGYGLYDSPFDIQYAAGGGASRDFFIVGESAKASTIEISEDIKHKPEDLPLSAIPGAPGNNEIALKLAALAYNTDFYHGQNPTDFYASFLGDLGNKASEATKSKETTALVATQLDNQRESTIGVNIDEEAVNLIKYQKAFEASSRIVNTTNEVLAVIVNLGR